MDERVTGRASVDLLAQAPHVDVDGSIAMRLATTPDLLQELVTGRNPPGLQGERVQKLELGASKPCTVPVYVRLEGAGVDAQLLDHDLGAARRLFRPDAATSGGRDACDELLHRERLHEEIVGPELERVDAVVLGPAGADDDDRRADALGARRLDHAPAVPAGKHEVEHADVGMLVAQARE